MLDLALPREVLVALLDLVGEKKRQVWPDLRRRTRRNKRRRTSGEALFHISLMSCCTAWSTSQRRGRSASGCSDGVERLEARREREEEERGNSPWLLRRPRLSSCIWRSWAVRNRSQAFIGRGGRSDRVRVGEGGVEADAGTTAGR